MAHRIELQYFKPSGKYYSSGEYTSDNEEPYDVHEEVRQLAKEKKLPGLIEGHTNFTVYVSYGFPVLIYTE